MHTVTQQQRTRFQAVLLSWNGTATKTNPKIKCGCVSREESAREKNAVRGMPELPEVEAARRAVEENCIGKKIRSAVVADDSKVHRWCSLAPSSKLPSSGKFIVAARRKGKEHVDLNLIHLLFLPSNLVLYLCSSYYYFKP
ncbi:MutM-like, N-terminal [Sesbania bispinosa]|nr:MutM-like, N-terminal [Sesbania bispinosa]